MNESEVEGVKEWVKIEGGKGKRMKGEEWMRGELGDGG